MNQLSLPIGGQDIDTKVDKTLDAMRYSRRYFFSERTQQVFDLVVQNKSHQEMQAAMNLTEKGVKYHVAKILKATGSRTCKDLRARLGLL
jgi:DNA-binding NarL/FixJ family response regulator